MVDQSGFDNQPISAEEATLSAREASERLGVKRATLYAYVSRGLVRAVPGEGRRKRYVEADVERLLARSRARSGHGAVAAGALRWGEPVLDTEIGDAGPQGLWYRGHDAVALAEEQGVGFEAVMELLMVGALPAAGRQLEVQRAPALGEEASLSQGVAHRRRCVDVMMAALPQMALQVGAARFGVRPQVEAAMARGLVAELAALCGLTGAGGGWDRVRRSREEAASVAAGLALAAGVEPGRLGEVSRAIDGALILCADHGLNVSSFAARTIASAGADLYACLQGALAAMSGPLHGGATERAEALVARLADGAGPEEIGARVEGMLRRGEVVPGFGHPLYPDGDPRAAVLLRWAAGRPVEAADGAALEAVLALVETMEEAGQPRPNLDMGLVALRAALGLPRGFALAIFAVGRVAGWAAHVLEQRSSDHLIRPRARYVGPPPSR